MHDGAYNGKIILKVQEKDGKTFIEPEEVKLVIKLKKADIVLENLFDGDKTLGAEMNKFLNENWEVVINDFSESFEKVVGEVVKIATKGILSSVPLEEIFPQ